MSDDDLDRFIGLREAAERLGIHKDTAWRLNKAGRFPIPVREVGGKKVVSLRVLVEFINRTDLEAAS
jgi:predicted DNA-binding transcriptional regulator AlpA